MNLHQYVGSHIYTAFVIIAYSAAATCVSFSVLGILCNSDMVITEITQRLKKIRRPRKIHPISEGQQDGEEH